MNDDVATGVSSPGNYGWLGGGSAFEAFMLHHGLGAQIEPVSRAFRLPCGEVMIPVKMRVKLGGEWRNMATELLASAGGRVVAVSDEAFQL